jgi:hypothetical protein
MLPPNSQPEFRFQPAEPVGRHHRKPSRAISATSQLQPPQARPASA